MREAAWAVTRGPGARTLEQKPHGLGARTGREGGGAAGAGAEEMGERAG